jgi:hypothetical protein
MAASAARCVYADGPYTPSPPSPSPSPSPSARPPSSSSSSSSSARRGAAPPPPLPPPRGVHPAALVEDLQIKVGPGGGGRSKMVQASTLALTDLAANLGLWQASVCDII